MFIWEEEDFVPAWLFVKLLEEQLDGAPENSAQFYAVTSFLLALDPVVKQMINLDFPKLFSDYEVGFKSKQENTHLLYSSLDEYLSWEWGDEEYNFYVFCQALPMSRRGSKPPDSFPAEISWSFFLSFYHCAKATASLVAKIQAIWAQLPALPCSTFGWVTSCRVICRSQTAVALISMSLCCLS